MAHVLGGVLLTAHAAEHDHIAVGIAGHNGAVAGLARTVKYPVGHVAAVVAAGIGAGVAGGLIILGHILQRLAALHARQHSGGIALGLGLGGGVLLIGGLHGVAVVVLGAVGGTLEVQGLIAGHVKAALVALIVGLQVADGVGQLLGVVALVMGGHVHQLHHLLEGIHGHVLAVDQLQIRLRGVAVLLGGGVELLHSGIQLLLSVLIGAHAVGLSLLGGQHVHGQLLHRGVADILLPCDITLVLDTQRGLHGVAHHLLVQGFGRIDAVKAGIAALQQTALHVGVEILHLPGGIFLTVDGHGGGAALQHAGVIHQQYRGHDHEHAGDHAVQDIVLACLGLLLRLADLLGVGDALGRQILPDLLFS